MELPEKLKACLERFIAEERPDLTLEEAAQYALADWCGLMGYRVSHRFGQENARKAISLKREKGRASP